MNKQQVYERIIEGILAQGGASTRFDENKGHTTCAYRGANGRKCAAGLLIPDDKYRREMEGWAADHPYVEPSIEAQTDDDDVLDFVVQCQRLHDEAAMFGGEGHSDEVFLPRFKGFMWKLGQEHHLAIPASVQPQNA